MTPITQDAVLAALSNVFDPDLKKDLVSLNMIRDLKIVDGSLGLDQSILTFSFNKLF